MAGTSFNWELYGIPSKAILQKRRDFYGLRRRKRESTSQWLNRIQKCINCCKFPSFVEFLVIDQFVCGLDANEFKSIQSAQKSWTLKQITELFLDRKNIENGQMNTNGALMIENGNKIERITAAATANIVKTDHDYANFSPNTRLKTRNAKIFAIEDSKNNSHATNKATPSRSNSECSEMSSLIDPSMVSDDDFDTNDETRTAANGMESRNISNGIQSSTPKRIDGLGGRRKSIIISSISKSDGHQYQITCLKCGKKSATNTAFIEHYRTEHMRLNDGNVYHCLHACELCDKRFISIADLERHLVTHNIEWPCASSSPRKSFNSMPKEDTHQQTVRQYACHLCGKRLKRKINLKLHMNMHTAMKSYTCYLCDKSFRHPSHLKKHEMRCRLDLSLLSHT